MLHWQRSRQYVGGRAVVDDLGALPVFRRTLDGNRNGFTAIREPYQLRQQQHPLGNELLIVPTNLTG